jgi:hypothetical protein
MDEVKEDNHFVAHPEGGITTASQVEADKLNAAPEVAIEPAAEQPATTEPTPEPTVEPEAKPDVEEPPATEEAVSAALAAEEPSPADHSPEEEVA